MGTSSCYDCRGIVANFHKPKHIKTKAKRDGEARKTPPIHVYSRLLNPPVHYSMCTNTDCDHILLTNSCGQAIRNYNKCIIDSIRTNVLQKIDKNIVVRHF